MVLKLGKVETYIIETIERKGCAHMTLLDPANFSPDEMGRYARVGEEQGTDAIMVGGSIIHSQRAFDECIKAAKENVSIPVIIFPNNVSAISQYADAIWFMSLLNSVDWYYIIGAQMQGSLLVKKYGLEAIPMGYLIFGSDSAVSAIGRALPLPPNRGEVAASYALAAQFLGMRFVYLEAGSGAPSPIPPDTIAAVRKAVEIKILVGGGITTPSQSELAARAGADVIVTGNVFERDVNILHKIVEAARAGASSMARA